MIAWSAYDCVDALMRFVHRRGLVRRNEETKRQEGFLVKRGACQPNEGFDQ